MLALVDGMNLSTGDGVMNSWKKYFDLCRNLVVRNAELGAGDQVQILSHPLSFHSFAVQNTTQWKTGLNHHTSYSKLR